MSTPLSTRESDQSGRPRQETSRSSLLSSITRHPLAPLLALWIAVVIYFWITSLDTSQARISRKHAATDSILLWCLGPRPSFS